MRISTGDGRFSGANFCQQQPHMCKACILTNLLLPPPPLPLSKDGSAQRRGDTATAARLFLPRKGHCSPRYPQLQKSFVSSLKSTPVCILLICLSDISCIRKLYSAEMDNRFKWAYVFDMRGTWKRPQGKQAQQAPSFSSQCPYGLQLISTIVQTTSTRFKCHRGCLFMFPLQPLRHLPGENLNLLHARARFAQSLQLWSAKKLLFAS